jgi:hypothetical protein
MREVGVLILLCACAVSAKDKGELVKVTAEKDSSTKTWTRLVDGDEKTYSDTTSFIKYRTGPHTITHLTMVCKVRWRWDKCYKLSANQDYDAQIDYKKKEVFITGQMEGNLGPTTTFKNQATNVVYEEEK